mmetsp:Transcript_42813/g.102434  ORF Transcript_42813/g.102434 Transcript_42813/m.102434 type:complete len:341 (-) Transcript_42813:41-1063(-)
MLCPPVMRRFEKMPRPAKAMVDPSAAKKPTQVKDSSPALASATPHMIGSRAKACFRGSAAPMTMKLPSAIQTGSLVFTTCVKETEPHEKATEVRPLPMAWQSAAGKSLHRKPGPMLLSGDSTMPLSQPTMEHATTAASCITEMVHACGKSPNACLLTMLNETLAAYQKKKPAAMATVAAEIGAFRCSATTCRGGGTMFIADSFIGVCLPREFEFFPRRGPRAAHAAASSRDCKPANSNRATGAAKPAQGALLVVLGKLEAWLGLGLCVMPSARGCGITVRSMRGSGAANARSCTQEHAARNTTVNKLNAGIRDRDRSMAILVGAAQVATAAIFSSHRMAM